MRADAAEELSPRRLVVAAVIVEDSAEPARLLAARRSVPLSLAGRWEFPGGKVEVGEDPRDALRRELQEELGVDVQLGDELLSAGGGPWPISEFYEMRTWWARITSGSVAPGHAHDAITWSPAAELTALPWLAADVAVAAEVQVRLGGLEP